MEPSASPEPVRHKPDQAPMEPLPPDWVQLSAPDSGAPYFYNMRTHESTWYRPASCGTWTSALPVLREVIASFEKMQSPGAAEHEAFWWCVSLVNAAHEAAEEAQRRWLVKPADVKPRQGTSDARSDAPAAIESDAAVDLSDHLAGLSLSRPASQHQANDTLTAAPTATKAIAPGVGDSVVLKRPDRSFAKGVVSRIEEENGASFFWVAGDDGERYDRWPAASIKRRGGPPRPTAEEDPRREAKVEFRIGGAKRVTKTASTAVPPRATALAPLAEPARSEVGPVARGPAEACEAPPPPARPLRMPRIIAVVDTNELLPQKPTGDRGYLPISEAHLLQGFQSRCCDVLLSTQVLIELDGLKRSDDAALAAAARRANALLAAAASARAPWLLLEDDATLARCRAGLASARDAQSHAIEAAGSCAAPLAPDEKIIACAVGFAAQHCVTFPRDRVILCTSDRNAMVRAVAAGLEAMPLDTLRESAAERDRAWRAAYCQSAASTALERASLSTAAPAASRAA